MTTVDTGVRGPDTAAPEATPRFRATRGLLQRQCKCGSAPAGLDDECPACRQKRLGGATGLARTGVTEDDLNRRGDVPATGIGGEAPESTALPDERMSASESNEAAEPPAPAESPAATSSLIVEDDAPTVGPGQMRRTEFLAQMRTTVCAAADDAMASTGRDTRGCPYVETWFNYYATRSASQIERSLVKYAPEAANVSAASDYMSIVASRVARGVSRWATTGEITEVPDELREAVFGGGILGAVASAVTSVVSSIASIFGKSREGGLRDADPVAIRSGLGAGTPLDGGVRTRMESAFGHDFSSVRLHHDSRAAELSDRVNARAFTIGQDVAFGAGEYQPGSPVGDALLAHELAHVVQQSNGALSNTPQAMGTGDYDSLEADADHSAVAAVASLWSGSGKGLASVAREAIPRMRSGLRLSRCPSRSTPPPTSRHPMTATTSGNSINFTFDPTAKSPRPHCDRIVNVQLIQMVVDGSSILPGTFYTPWTCRDAVALTGSAHYIDHDCGCTTPYYTDCFNGTAGSSNGTTANSTSMDAPTGYNLKSTANPGGFSTIVYNFETYGYCGKGTDCGQFYEGIQWTYTQTAAAGGNGTSATGYDLGVPAATSTVVSAFNRFNSVKSFTPC